VVGVISGVGEAITGALSTLGFGAGEQESKEELPEAQGQGQVGRGRGREQTGSGASVLREVLSERINERHQSRMALQRLQEGFGRQAEAGAFGENLQHTAIERRGEQEGVGLLNRLRGSIQEPLAPVGEFVPTDPMYQTGGRRSGRGRRGSGGGGVGVGGLLSNLKEGGIEQQGSGKTEDTPTAVVTVVKEG